MWIIASAIDDVDHPPTYKLGNIHTNYAHRCDATNAQSHSLEESVHGAAKIQLSEDPAYAD